MRPFSQIRPYCLAEYAAVFSRICGGFAYASIFRISVPCFAHVFSAYMRDAAGFFFNPHICGNYSDLICIWGHFYFQNAYMYATVQIIRISWKLEVIQKKDCITLLRKMPRMSKSSEPTQLNHSLAKLKIISLIIWTRGIALHIDRNDFNETRSPIGAWEVKLEI